MNITHPAVESPGSVSVSPPPLIGTVCYSEKTEHGGDIDNIYVTNRINTDSIIHIKKFNFIWPIRALSVDNGPNAPSSVARFIR